MNAPSTATTAPASHTARMSGTDCTRCATTAGLRKMPAPMMPPTTIMVPEKSPTRRA
jgi:hypothetical protein